MVNPSSNSVSPGDVQLEIMPAISTNATSGDLLGREVTNKTGTASEPLLFSEQDLQNPNILKRVKAKIGEIERKDNKESISINIHDDEEDNPDRIAEYRRLVENYDKKHPQAIFYECCGRSCSTNDRWGRCCFRIEDYCETQNIRPPACWPPSIKCFLYALGRNSSCCQKVICCAATTALTLVGLYIAQGKMEV